MNTYVRNRPQEPVADSRNQAFDILELTQRAGELSALANGLKSQYGQIDLVVGGPPCQGYSGIGHRRSFDVTKEMIPSNHLYREMAKVVEAVGPRAFVFENVRGLLNARWVPEGEKGEIWADVQKAFQNIDVKVGRKKVGYRIGWQLVHAKDYGVPQNRPRVIMVGVREDIEVTLDGTLPAQGLLPAPFTGAPDPIDALGDLVDPQWTPGGETLKYPQAAKTEFQELMRFEPKLGRVLPKGATVTEHEYSNHADHIIAKFQYMIENDGEIPESMRTKKFAQRVLPVHWDQRGPTITATSLADDYVHFSQPRSLTVREWARLQTFPDWYQFAGKRTTGGRRRAGDPDAGDWSREVPKYTQIGNAVPVLLAQAVGDHLMGLLHG
jgi:DNA (cytosine-5)-methyltransferase 1